MRSLGACGRTCGRGWIPAAPSERPAVVRFRRSGDAQICAVLDSKRALLGLARVQAAATAASDYGRQCSETVDSCPPAAGQRRAISGPN